jgi:hypothetical protein
MRHVYLSKLLRDKLKSNNITFTEPDYEYDCEDPSFELGEDLHIQVSAYGNQCYHLHEWHELKGCLITVASFAEKDIDKLIAML